MFVDTDEEASAYADGGALPIGGVFADVIVAAFASQLVPVSRLNDEFEMK